jgi:cytochrome c-type biogenesis protein CcmH/NrfG
MLFKLLSAPFTLPLAGVKFAFQQIADMADQELNDDSVVREQLILLQVELEEGDIDEEEFVEREAELMVRLREIRARQRAELDEIPAEANVEARRRVIVETPFDE